MIKLFRNIRKKIITENSSVNRNTNYFKYAIGMRKESNNNKIVKFRIKYLSFEKPCA